MVHGGKSARIISLGILTIALLSGLSGPLHAFQLTISPPRIDLAIESGSLTEGTIAVSGKFDQPTRIRVTAGDWALKSNGDILYQAGGTLARSLTKWITVSPAEFILTSERTQILRYRIQAPTGITGGYWGALFFQNVAGPAPAKGSGNVGVYTIGRLAALIYAETERGAVRDGKVTMVSIQQKGDNYALATTFANLGNLMVRLKGRFEIRNAASNKVLAKVNFDDLPVLPGTARDITAAWQGRLDAGSYVLFALVDFGGKNMVAGQRSFTIK